MSKNNSELDKYTDMDELLSDHPELLDQYGNIDENLLADLDENKDSFGEKEFRRKQGDKDYYNKKRDDINSDLDKAKEEKNKDTKEVPPEENKQDEKKKDSSKEDNKNKDKEEKESAPEKDKDGREIVGKKADGTEIVKKNKKDHREDQRNINKLKVAQAKNKIDSAKSKAYEISHPIEAGKEYGKQKAKQAIKDKVITPIIQKIAPYIPYILLGIGIVLLVFFIIALIYGVVAAIFQQENDKTKGAYGYGYYDAPCQEITVTGDDAGTYSLEDYVAGVVQREVGGWNNLVVDQTFAIAARTYGLRRAANNNCTIENSTSAQVFTSHPGDVAIEAAQSTKGIVLTDGNGNLLSTEYDALAVASRNSSYITLKQQGQQIPTSWILEHISESTLSYYEKHNHGRGMSQWGARYLAEQGKNYEEILSYYYTDAVFKSTFVGAGIEGIPDYPLDTSSTTILRGQSLANFLSSKGTSIEEFNNLIAANVSNAGYGTRSGVVAAAVTLIGEMDKYGIKLPYVWGGGHSSHGGISQGADGNWGVRDSGLDCSGFIAWAIYNGGYNFNDTQSTHFKGLGEVVELDAKNAVISPGDVLVKSGHVALVVGIDEERKEYITAEALGARYGILFKRRKFNEASYSGVKMDSYYSGNQR